MPSLVSGHGEGFERWRLFIPGELLRFVEVLDPANIQPKTVVQECANGQAPSQHAEHEVVEAERNPGRDVIEHFRLHAIDAHAYQVGEDRLLLEAPYPSSNVLDDPEVRMNDPLRRGNGQGATVLMVTRRERVDVKVRQHVSVDDQEGAGKVVAQQGQAANRAERLRFLRILDSQVPLPTVPADGSNEMAQIPGCDIGITRAVPAQPFEQELQDRFGAD